MRLLGPLLSVAISCAPISAAACQLALVLGVDVSHSIDNTEYAFQIGGMAEALNDPVIAGALVEQQAAIAVVQWSGVAEQEISIPWTNIRVSSDVRALSQRMRTLARPWDSSNTAVGAAIDTMTGLIREGPRCARQVIDFSGDGINNSGPLPQEARGRAIRNGITINGLAIDRIGLSVTQYYRGHVITGRDSFVVTAKGFRDYPRAIRMKLFRELLPPSS